jgi:hypothetical protein
MESITLTNRLLIIVNVSLLRHYGILGACSFVSMTRIVLGQQSF